MIKFGDGYKQSKVNISQKLYFQSIHLLDIRNTSNFCIVKIGKTAVIQGLTREHKRGNKQSMHVITGDSEI